MTAFENPTDNGNREFVIAACRTTRTRLQLLACEVDEIGVALKHDMLPLESAVAWLPDLNVLQFVNPDVWRSQPATFRDNPDEAI